MPIHQKTITVSPADDVYAWTKSGDSNGSWITITNAQNAGVDTDTWNFTVGANTGAQRAAVCTVTHSNGTTAESFTITQATGGSPVVVPTISTGAPTQPITETSIVFTGNEDNNGGEALTARGFKVGLAANTLGSTFPVSLSGGTGFFKNVTGLTGGTTYYAQAYGTNSAGEGTGITVSATTLAAAPSLSFNSFSVEAQNNPDGINVPEPNPSTSFNNNALITITSTNVPDGYYIPVVSITKVAPSASAGQYADFNASNSSLLIGSTINDLGVFTFSNDEATGTLRVQPDNTTEGNETYRVTISPDYLDANDNVIGQHGLSAYVDFIILDNSISTATELGYNNASNYGALGSPTTSTSGNTSFSTYTFNNSGGTYGPSHNILFKANTSADPVYNTSSTNTVNTFYWSLDSEGVTNDSAAINGNGSSCVVNSTAMNPNGQGGSGVGFLGNNHGFILFSDGQASGGSSPLAPSPLGFS
jgi:hypothetical protein